MPAACAKGENVKVAAQTTKAATAARQIVFDFMISPGFKKPAPTCFVDRLSEQDPRSAMDQGQKVT